MVVCLAVFPAFYSRMRGQHKSTGKNMVHTPLRMQSIKPLAES